MFLENNFTPPILKTNGYAICGCKTCGAAIFIDSQRHDGDGRQIHDKWHENERRRAASVEQEGPKEGATCKNLRL